ncbi:MAG: hypothetical protein V9G12_11925 [Microthrixaceae bacterium]
MEPGFEARPDEEAVAEAPLEMRPLLDLADQPGIPTDARVEEEVSAVHRADADAVDRLLAQRDERRAQRVDGVVAQPERPGEHVRGAAREGSERDVGSDEAVGGLVEGAVAAEHGDDVDTVVDTFLRELGGVTPVAGLDHPHVVGGGEQPVDRHLASGGDRGRRRVHDEEDLHDVPTVAVLG